MGQHPSIALVTAVLHAAGIGGISLMRWVLWGWARPRALRPVHRRLHLDAAAEIRGGRSQRRRPGVGIGLVAG